MLKGNAVREFGLLGTILCADTLLSIVVARHIPFYVNTGSTANALDFAANQRISSTFSPIGYPALLGIGALLGGATGMVVVSISLSLLVIVAAWFYLRAQGLSIKTTVILAGLLSIYPDFLLSVNKAQDTAITACLLFALVTLLVKASEEASFGPVDVGLGLTLGLSLLVRPNLLLFLFLSWFVFWRFGVRKALSRSFVQAIIVVACYLGGTAAFHGRPFFPQNGPYNLCAGFNERTQNYTNYEDSLFLVLSDHGVKPPDGTATFTLKNLNDRRLDPVFTHLALQFIQQHPGAALRLLWVKFENLMRPDLQVHPARSVGGMVKILSALGIPLWVVAMVLLPHPGSPRLKYILVLAVLIYILPFELTVSSPRFRVPLDFLCWVDLGGMLAARMMRHVGTTPLNASEKYPPL